MQAVTIEPFSKKLNICNRYSSNQDLTVKINFDGSRLSICGECNGKNGESYGQILDCLDIPESEMTNGWTDKKLRVLRKVWERYHLNDMRAGTPEQEKCARRHRKSYSRLGLPSPSYDLMCQILMQEGLYRVIDENGNEYTYGSQWKFEPVPKIILDWLKNL